MRRRKTIPAKRRADLRKSRGTWILSIVTSIWFDGLISGNALNAELEKPDESKDGEFAVYQKKLIAYVAGEQYVMYFDETDTKTETEIDDGVEEVEISSKVTGVLVKGEYVFEVSGKYETEREGTEIETEMEFVTRSFDTPDNYVKVEPSRRKR